MVAYMYQMIFLNLFVDYNNKPKTFLRPFNYILVHISGKCHKNNLVCNFSVKFWKQTGEISQYGTINGAWPSRAWQT